MSEHTPKSPITGLHHVTATVTDAQADLDFYVGLLGLRLVKQTVNFDNPGVYHFYYGDEQGTPSTIMTTFPYRGWGVPVGRRGAGQIGTTTFAVPAGALAEWEERLRDAGAGWEADRTPLGEPVFRLEDPSGLLIELREVEGDSRAPWTGGGVPAEIAISGVESVLLTLRDPLPTLELLTGLLGYREVGRAGSRIRVEVGAGGPGRALELEHVPDAPPAVNGLGTVHHVAMAISQSDQQLQLRSELLSAGFHVTEVRDRCYFQSIYFREPGGVLFEVATEGPGFAIDEEPGQLGEALRLPPWEEANRPQIEAQLAPIELPKRASP